MSKIRDSTSSDEDESYRNMTIQKTGYNIEDATIIDESYSDTNINIETSLDLDKSTNNPPRRSIRESGIFSVRKKPVRLLDSEEESDSDHETFNDYDSSGSSGNRLLEETQDEKYTLPSDYDLSSDSEEGELENQKLKKYTLPSDYDLSSNSEEGELENQKLKNKSTPHNDTKTGSSGSKNKSVHNNTDSGSDTNCQNEVPRLIDGAEISQEINGVTSPQNVASDQPNDDLNLSKKTGNSRRSQNFQYNVAEVLEKSADPSVEILSDHDSDVIEVSSDEQLSSPTKTPFKLPIKRNAARQQTLHSFVIKSEASTPLPKKPVIQTQQSKPLVEKQNFQPTNRDNIQPKSHQNVQSTNQEKIPKSPKVIVSRTQYESQWNKVNSLELDYMKLQNMLDNINYEALPDKGKLIKERVQLAQNRYKEEKDKMDKMDISETKVDETPQGAFAHMAWEDIEAGTNAVLPKTFGKAAMSTYNAQKAVTLDRLQQLHEAIRTCPKEDDLEEDPKGIKVPLMPHQKRALAWVLFREKEKPSGGILADDMGLGKTLTMLSLIVKSLYLERNDDSDEENQYIGKHTKYDGGSLIVCPASLINQWSGEIERRLKRGLISYVLYHGPKRETNPKKLAKYDVVITTYAIVNNEAEKQSAAFKIKWRRVILDEAHTIRNHKAQTSEACCQLSAKSRWALTGTPMHNKELDMYALLKFLRCSPFDDLQVWKRWVGDKSSGGVERLHTVISSLMLRRTKVELMEKGALNCMPEKKWELVHVELDKNEMTVYHKVMIFSQTLFAQFLHQRAEKNQDYMDQKFPGVSNDAPNQEYHKMRQKLLKLNKVKDVSQHEILVLLLRLRQICCHPSLITAMLDENRDELASGDEESEQLNLLDQLEKLNIEDDDEHQPDASLGAVAVGLSQDKITLKEASKGHFHPSDPVFAKERASSKIKTMIKVLQEKVIAKNEKAIIVSQWSSYLKLVAMHIKDLGIEFDQLDGQVPVNKRMDMVDRLNNPKDRMTVLLLSLTAGGVGLNLVGANHLFLLDLHWNPQLENQAQDRIYRVGQTKPVFVYKFMAVDTIEERIKSLQDKKLAMAEGLLTGTKQATQSKLSLQDLRMIFGM